MQEITFWDLISSTEIKRISIPTIQRDYAQGRRNKVYIRHNFLNALKDALCTGKQLILDFIYGVDNETMFIPLDGQQRLTTLWVLHWFLAYKSGKLQEDDIKCTLAKFSYETRTSSSDFCKSLCGLSVNKDNKPLRDWITRQTWFYHHYKQDPTIMGMLNMIAGTKTNDKKEEDIPDGLEEIFTDTECDYCELWNKLINTKCIQFNKLQISENDSDELYVKMNARGRQLTDFENFKAELVQHVSDGNILDENEVLEFAAKLDVEWTDIFWENRWEDPLTNDITIDEIYFAFIRRFARLECIRKMGEDSNVKEQFTPVFTSFQPYKQVLDKVSVMDFIKIMDRLRGNKLKAKALWGDCFDFVPKYKNGNKRNITTLTDKTKLLFYGYCRYLIHGEYDENSFAEWCRVLWNICENRADNNLILPTMRLIDELAPHSHEILAYLSQETDIDFKQNKAQMLEEQCKARRFSEFRNEILEMEGYAFFKGAIRFLFTDSNNKVDWDSFKTKIENVKLLIPIDKNERHTIKLLTPYITKEKALCDIYYNWVSNNDEDLRKILLDSKSVPYLHHFLLQDEKKYQSLLHQDIIELCEDTFNSGYIQTNWRDDSQFIWTERETRRGYYQWVSYVINNALYASVSNIIDSSDPNLFEIYKEQKNRRTGKHIQGLYLHFKYKQQYFLTMFGNNTICLMTDEWEKKYPNSSDSKGFYIPLDGIKTEEDLVEQIDLLLKKNIDN